MSHVLGEALLKIGNRVGVLPRAKILGKAILGSELPVGVWGLEIGETG